MDNYTDMLQKPYYDKLISDLIDLIEDSELTRQSILTLLVIAYNKGAAEGIESFKQRMNGDY